MGKKNKRATIAKAMLVSINDSKEFGVIRKTKCKTEPEQDTPKQHKQLLRQAMKKCWCYGTSQQARQFPAYGKHKDQYMKCKEQQTKMAEFR